MRKIPILLAALALALAGCGDSGDGDGGSDESANQTAAAPDCVATWNDKASPDQRAKASLSHRGDAGEPVLVGRYSGGPFTATGETFDASGSPTTAEVAVAKGDCAAVDLTSNDSEVNWAMAYAKPEEGGGPGWYFLPTDADHGLAKPPPPLDGRVETIIAGFGEEARLSPKP
jgi:hypothetical protein